MYQATLQLVKEFNCKHIFSGGAGGYVPSTQEIVENNLPPIGTRIPITSCISNDKKINLSNKDENKRHHLHVITIFQETYKWLNMVRAYGQTVDIETFYILKAITDAGIYIVKVDCGIFVSDYVGSQALRSYNKVYSQYDAALLKFLENVKL